MRPEEYLASLEAKSQVKSDPESILEWYKSYGEQQQQRLEANRAQAALQSAAKEQAAAQRFAEQEAAILRAQQEAAVRQARTENPNDPNNPRVFFHSPGFKNASYKKQRELAEQWANTFGSTYYDSKWVENFRKNPDQFIGITEPKSTIGEDAFGIWSAAAAGLVGGVKALTDLAGADNAASEYLREEQENLKSLYSAEQQERNKQLNEQSQKYEEEGSLLGQALTGAERILTTGTGVGELIGGTAAAVVPGSIVGRFAQGAALAKGATAAAAAAKGTKAATTAMTATGAAIGAGSVKGGIVEAIQNASDAELMGDPSYALMRKNGLSEKQAKEQFGKEQSEYMNSPLAILAGATAGALAARLGSVEGAAAGAGGGGFIRGAGREVLTEAPQAATEVLATNLGASDAIPATRGLAEALGAAVAGGAALGGPAGLVQSRMDRLAAQQQKPPAQTPPPTPKPEASNVEIDNARKVVTEYEATRNPELADDYEAALTTLSDAGIIIDGQPTVATVSDKDTTVTITPEIQDAINIIDEQATGQSPQDDALWNYATETLTNAGIDVDAFLTDRTIRRVPATVPPTPTNVAVSTGGGASDVGTGSVQVGDRAGQGSGQSVTGATSDNTGAIPVGTQRTRPLNEQTTEQPVSGTGVDGQPASNVAVDGQVTQDAPIDVQSLVGQVVDYQGNVGILARTRSGYFVNGQIVESGMSGQPAQTLGITPVTQGRADAFVAGQSLGRIAPELRQPQDAPVETDLDIERDILLIEFEELIGVDETNKIIDLTLEQLGGGSNFQQQLNAVKGALYGYLEQATTPTGGVEQVSGTSTQSRPDQGATVAGASQSPAQTQVTQGAQNEEVQRQEATEEVNELVTDEDVELAELESQLAEIDAAANKIRSSKTLNLFSALKGTLSKSERIDSSPDKIYRMLQAKQGGVDLSSLVEDGALNDFLPYNMRPDSSRFDSNDSVEYIKEKLRSSNFLPYDVEIQLGMIDNQRQELESAINEIKSIREINNELQQLAEQDGLARSEGGIADAAGVQAGVLTSPSQAEVVAQQERSSTAGEIDQREQVRRESEAGAGTFELAREDGRVDNTGDMFSQPAPVAETKPATTVAQPESTVQAPQNAPLSIGVTPSSTESVTVKDGVVHVGKYPAQNFDTGEDVTVPASATNDQIKKALTDAGAVGARQKFFNKEGTDVRFSEGEGQITGNTADKVNATLKEEGLDRNNIKVVQSVDQVSEGSKSVDINGVQGFYNPATGEVTLFADKIPEGREAGVALHEVFHRAEEDALTTEQRTELTKQVERWKVRDKKTNERQIYDAAKRRAEKSGDESGEFLAYAIEEARNMGIQPNAKNDASSAEGWLAKVKKFFNDALKKLAHDYKGDLTASDLVDIAYGVAARDAEMQQTKNDAGPKIYEWANRGAAPIGAWVKADYKLAGSQPVYQVQDLPVDSLYLPELDEKGRLQPEKRKYIDAYTERAKAGEKPPAISVIEMEDGKMRVVDGHRRAVAAKAADVGVIRALVSPLVDTPNGRVEATTENIRDAEIQAQGGNVSDGEIRFSLAPQQARQNVEGRIREREENKPRPLATRTGETIAEWFVDYKIKARNLIAEAGVKYPELSAIGDRLQNAMTTARNQGNSVVELLSRDVITPLEQNIKNIARSVGVDADTLRIYSGEYAAARHSYDESIKRQDALLNDLQSAEIEEMIAKDLTVLARGEKANIAETVERIRAMENRMLKAMNEDRDFTLSKTTVNRHVTELSEIVDRLSEVVTAASKDGKDRTLTNANIRKVNNAMLRLMADAVRIGDPYLMLDAARKYTDAVNGMANLPKAKEQLSKAKEKLAEWQKAQSTPIRIDKDKQDIATEIEIPGGMTMAEAKAIMDMRGQQGGVVEAADAMVQAYKDINSEAVRSGIITAEKKAELEAEFPNYVSMSGDKNASADDDFMFSRGRNFIDKAQGRKNFMGQQDAFNNVIAKSQQLGNKVAAQALARPAYDYMIAESQVVPETERLFEKAKVPGENTMKVYSAGQTQYFKGKNEDMRFGIGELTNARFELPKALSSATMGYGSLVTQYIPVFAPINGFRDFFTRAFNTVQLRNMRKPDGSRYSMGDVYAIRGSSMASIMSPSTWGDSIKYAFTKQTSPDMESLIRNGGKMSFSDMLNSEATVSKAFKKKFPKVGKLMDVVTAYNQTFETAVILSAYKGLRANGMSEKDAASFVVSQMNFGAKGVLTDAYLKPFYAFANPVMQDAMQVKRSLYNNGKPNYQGIAELAALAAISAFLYSMLRDASDDPEDFDAKSMMEVTSSWILPNGAKVPVPFGMIQLANVIGVAKARMDQGLLTAGEASAEIATSWFKAFSPVGSSEISASKDFFAFMSATLAPTLGKPVVLAAMDKTPFGQKLTDNERADTYRSEQGKRNTPEFYKQKARELREFTGVDMTPETTKSIFEGYAIGPLRGILDTIVDPAGDREMKGGDTSAMFSPLAKALGVNRLISRSNEARATYDQFNRASSDFEALSRKFNVAVPKTANTEKRSEKLNRWEEAGATDAELNFLDAYLEYENVTRTENREMTNIYKSGVLSDVPELQEAAREELADREASKMGIMQEVIEFHKAMKAAK